MNLDERIGRYLAKCPPCIAGSGGDEQLFRVACSLEHGFGLDESEALRWLTHYNASCLPPWPEHRLRHKVQQSVRVTHDKARGHLLGNARPEPPRRSKGEKGGPKPVSLLPKPPKGDLRTLRTLPVNPSHDACMRAPTLRKEVALEASEASAPAPPPPLVIPVPGCLIPRPAAVDLPDADWRALESVGMAGEPLVLAALRMFGPGCRVTGSEVGE